MRSDLKYDRDRPIRRLEAGDVAVISVIHFPESIVRDRDKIKYAHIPNGKYPAKVVEPYHLCCEEYPELSGKYNYWRGDKYGCSDGIYAYELNQDLVEGKKNMEFKELKVVHIREITEKKERVQRLYL